MAEIPISIDRAPQWWALAAHQAEIADVHLRELFDADPTRGARMVLAVGDLHVDYAKHRIDDTTLSLLFDLARAAGVEELRDAMFAGARINVTEDRSVLHTALRASRGTSLEVDGHDVVAEVHEVLDRMAAFSRRIRSGEWVGHTGRPIRTVINVGIGGSDLGPHMAHDALKPFVDPSIQFRFLSNVDGDEFFELTYY